MTSIFQTKEAIPHCTKPASMVNIPQFNSLLLIRDVSYMPKIDRVKLLFILLQNVVT